MGYIPPPSEAVIGGIPFRTVGVNDSGAYYQQAASEAGIGAAMNRAQLDQNSLFFLIWVLANTSAYQVETQMQIVYANAQIWGTGTAGTGVTTGTCFQPIANPPYTDMWVWAGQGQPGAIDIKFIQFDGSNLVPTVQTLGATGGTIYTNASNGIQLANLGDPGSQISGGGRVYYTQGGTYGLNTPTTAIVHAGDTTVSVTSAAGFPGSGSYFICIEYEVMKVTSGAGTTTWTVQRGMCGTAAVQHPSGALVGTSGGPLGMGPGNNRGASNVQFGMDKTQGTSSYVASVLLGPGDSLTFTYTGGTMNTGTPGTNLSLTTSVLNSFLNITASNDNTHPIDLYELTFTQCGAVTFALYVQGCQESYIGRVFINGSTNGGQGSGSVVGGAGYGGASYLAYLSLGGSAWMSEGNVSGYLLHGLVIKISGGNIGGNGIWIPQYGNQNSSNTNFGDPTTVTVTIEQTHWDGPKMVPCFMNDNPSGGHVNMLGGSITNGGNYCDGYISGQNPTLLRFNVAGMLKLQGGNTHSGIPLHAVAGLAAGYTPAYATGHIANYSDNQTAATLFANTQREGLYFGNNLPISGGSILMASVSDTPANPTAGTTAGEGASVMAGFPTTLGRTFTPVRTGVLKATVTGYGANATLNDGFYVQVRAGAVATGMGASTLNGTITSGATTLVVTANASFPSSNGFYILIDSEVLKVTAGAGTNNWTVSRAQLGTTAAAHTNTAAIAQYLPFLAESAVGSAYGNPVQAQSAVATDQVTFALTVRIPSLTVGQKYWIDVAFAAITGGAGHTATISSVTITVEEALA